jgi:ABC-type antimicrobial peptide transport system permease subunit
MVHFASAQRPSRYNILMARTSGDAAVLLAQMRHDLLAMEPGLVFMHNGTMDQGLATSLLPARVGAVLAAGFGGLGTLLAAIGLYGVIAFSVARRTREIGVRIALGAQPAGVLAMVMRQGFMLVAIGLVVGGILAASAGQVIKGLLFGVSTLDPIAWALAITAMVVAAALANLVPARRAMRVDPMTALRTD